MGKDRIGPDTTCYSSIISACAKGKQWEFGLQLLEECKAQAKPNVISYSAAISACEKGEQWQRVFALL